MSDTSQGFAVLDTSVWINLLATEKANRIIEALGKAIVLPPQVLRELRYDPVSNRPFDNLDHPALKIPLVKRSALVGDEIALFLDLVAASRPNGLGDGEAASIAIAVHRRAVIAVDETKARRIISERFPTLSIVRSVDILNDESIIRALGVAEAQECFAKACRFGRMHTIRPV